MAPQAFLQETRQLRSIASNPNCNWEYTEHALERMKERGITAADVEQVLINGHVILEERKKDILWRIRGRDIDGRAIQVVAAVYEDSIKIKVVTVF
jgi:hypothetical protein